MPRYTTPVTAPRMTTNRTQPPMVTCSTLARSCDAYALVSDIPAGTYNA